MKRPAVIPPMIISLVEPLSKEQQESSRKVVPDSEIILFWDDGKRQILRQDEPAFKKPLISLSPAKVLHAYTVNLDRKCKGLFGVGGLKYTDEHDVAHRCGGYGHYYLQVSNTEQLLSGLWGHSATLNLDDVDERIHTEACTAVSYALEELMRYQTPREIERQRERTSEFISSRLDDRLSALGLALCGVTLEGFTVRRASGETTHA